MNYCRSCKRIDKARVGDWITSGSLGSRDAVLVFRTDILNTRPNLTSETIIDSDTAAAQIKNPLRFTSLLNTKTVERSKQLLDNISQPVTSSKPSAVQPLRVEPKSVSAKVPKNIIRIVASEKQFCDSLSSSDNSISSEGDEPEEIEKEVAAGADGCEQYENTTSTIDSADDTDAGGYDGEDDVNTSGHLKERCDDYTPASGMPAVELKLTYKFIQTETKLLRKIFARHGLTEAEEDENFSILWTGIHMKPDILRNLAPYQRVNHFPR